MDHLGDRQSLLDGGGELEDFSMSAVDMSMIHHIPDCVENGADSLKIDGRMKSIHYVSTVSNVYRQVVDAYCADPDHFEFKQEWEDELWKVAQRKLATGFYYGPLLKINSYSVNGVKSRNMYLLVKYWITMKRHKWQQSSNEIILLLAMKSSFMVRALPILNKSLDNCGMKTISRLIVLVIR